jgi:hypothetical protein
MVAADIRAATVSCQVYPTGRSEIGRYQIVGYARSIKKEDREALLFLKVSEERLSPFYGSRSLTMLFSSLSSASVALIFS